MHLEIDGRDFIGYWRAVAGTIVINMNVQDPTDADIPEGAIKLIFGNVF